jgi:hypothetical protein
MTLKTRLATLEAAQYERELDRHARFLAERYHLAVAEVRREIEAILARRQAEGGPPLSAEELKRAEELRHEIDEWEANRG